MSGPYDDIILLSHHVSSRHPQMPRENRAAQFSPFAALTGYEESLRESARGTTAKRELDEDARAMLDMKLHILTDAVDARPEVSVVYFERDPKKEGGAYVTATGALKKIDVHVYELVLMDGRRIDMNDVWDIDCALLKGLE